VVSLVACLCLSCVAPRRGGPREPAEPTAAFRQVLIGVCEDYPEGSRTLDIARRDLEMISTNGLRVLRISFDWSSMEPEPGRYDWSFWDEFVRVAADEYGIQLIPFVCGTPRWASTGTGDDFRQYPPKNNAQFAGFMRQIVDRYKSRIHSWEIWNEPDNLNYWRGSVGQYAALLQAGSRAVHEADPRSKVVMGGLAWNLTFLGAVLTNTEAIRDVDVINLHNYYETWASQPLERIPDYVGSAYDLIHDRGQHQAIWMAEGGFSGASRAARISDKYEADFRNQHTPELQAAGLFRVFSLLLASDKVSLIAWCRIRDLPGAQEVVGDDNNRHPGLLDPNGRPKSALFALKFFHSLFPYRLRCIDRDIRVSKATGSPVEIHAFQRYDGNVVVVAWLKTQPPGARGNDLGGPGEDVREAEIDLELPFPTESTAIVFDEIGNREKTIPVSRHEAGVQIRGLGLPDERVTVLELTRTKTGR
jgi:cellulase (glycosyl hydrolase family 5)